MAPRLAPRIDGRQLVAIFVGGAVGTLARAGLAEAFPHSATAWPWPTFTVNVVAAVLLGYFVTRLQERLPLSSYRRPLLGTGLCGGLSTFSTMQVEILRMIQGHAFMLAAGYAAASVVVGLPPSRSPRPWYAGSGCGHEGAVFSGVVVHSVLPAFPDHVQPGSCEDADGVGVVVPAGSCAVVQVGGPGVGASRVGGEVGDSVAQLLVAGPAEPDCADLAALSGRGCRSGKAAQGFGGGEARAAVADLGQQSGGAYASGAGQRGEDVRVGVQVSCSSIWVHRHLICSTRVVRTASSARVM